MGSTPEWIIWGVKSFCQCKSTLVYSSSVGSYDFFISLKMFDLVFGFFLKDSASGFMLLHLSLRFKKRSVISMGEEGSWIT